MINFVERPDLPAPILRALQDPYYEEGLAEHFESIPEKIRNKCSHHFSVTTLPRAPRQRVLFARHSSKITLDPLSAFWRMFGHIKHEILSRYSDPGDIVDGHPLSRQGIIVDGCYVHGQVDRIVPSRSLLQDWKVTKAESMLYPDKFEYHAQANILAYIFRKHGLRIEELETVYLFRSWDARMVGRNPLYPREQVMVVNVPMWDDAKTLAYIKQRIKIHKAAEQMNDDELPFCTDAERWVGLPYFRVVKIDPKTGQPQQKAKHKGNSRLECEDWMRLPENRHDAKGNVINYIIDERKAKPSRCEFCEISNFCNQRMAELQDQFAGGDDDEQ